MSRLRQLSAPLLALVLLVSSLPDAADAAQRRRRASAPPTRRRAPARTTPAAASNAGADARVRQIGDEYLRGHFAFNPTEATAAGLHEYDAQLESRSAEAVAREVRRLRQTLAELRRLPEWRLSSEARYDYLVLQSHAQARLLELEDVGAWRRDPNVYNNLASASVDNVMKRDFAPYEQRLEAMLARERQIPRLLEEARRNLSNPPRVYTETAIEQTRGSLDFFTRVVPQLVERAARGRLTAARRAEISATNESAVSALRSFAEWLETDLLPRSNGDFQIGAENFRRKLLYEEMVDTPLAELVRVGEEELRRTQEVMRALAEEVAPGRGVASALQLIGREHPSASGLVGEARAELDRLRAFVRNEEILSPPPRENLIVAETPEYARALTFASMDTPGPFERNATEAFYYVTPPDAAWSARQRDEHLSHFNRYLLPLISIHEAYPGHYYQLLALRGSPSRVRTALGSASFIEGWAHYCEQMMIDEGYGGGDPRLRLAQQAAALLRLCRYLVGIKMHTEGMTYEQAVELFVNEAYMERVAAEREARHARPDLPRLHARQDADTRLARRVARASGRLVPPRRVSRPASELRHAARQNSSHGDARRQRRAARRRGVERRGRGRAFRARRVLRAGDGDFQRLRGRARGRARDGRGRVASRVGLNRRRAPRARGQLQHARRRLGLSGDAAEGRLRRRADGRAPRWHNACREGQRATSGVRRHYNAGAHLAVRRGLDTETALGSVCALR
ncbi:MAG TPA: DUF885 domain-containing protein [Pyrinomonadaceae bacterium]|nr:DUF885 domain-containing protein [Pyrinomonadaceae bacterium]